jgi:plastocyanin
MQAPKMHRTIHHRRGKAIYGCIAAAVTLLWLPSARAQSSSVTGQIEIFENGTAKQADAAHRASTASNAPSNAVVWLVPSSVEPGSSPSLRSRPPAQLVQRNKSFDPHVLVVEVGTTVQFPNKDPFFHNVFSLFDGKRFDLGLYESGSSNSVRFDRAGISFLFCNIHPEMSAMVIAVPTPYFAISDAAGHWTIANVPNGRYRIHLWYERSAEGTLSRLQTDVILSDANRTLQPIRIAADAVPNSAHKNKYGKDYVPASSPSYSNP